MSWVWYYTASDGEELWGVSNISSLSLLLGPLGPKVVIPVKVLSMGQMGLFENY